MRVLMISLDASLLGDPHGNTVQRHMAYAERIGELAIVVYNPASPHRTLQTFSPALTVYPTNTRPYFYPWVATRIAMRLQREQPFDLVTTQDPFATGLVGLLLKWRFKLPLDVQNHSSFFKNPAWIAERPLRNRALLRLGKFVAHRADTHRVMIEGEKQNLVALGIAPDRIAVQHTPIDVSKFAESIPAERVAALRDRLGIAPNAQVVLWVGKASEVKNIPLLLDAFAPVRVALPEARLVLAGDFSQRPDWAALAAQAGAILPGRVSHDDLPLYYTLADVYAHSSRYEGLSKVLVEALATGTPVVTTDGDGARATVRNNVTGLITAHTAEALAAALLRVLRDDDLRQKMGTAGRADITTRFDYAQQLDTIVDTFRHTLAVTRKGTH